MTLSKVEKAARNKSRAKEWLSQKISYSAGDLLLMMKIFALYHNEGGALSQRGFYSIIRESIPALFPGLDVAVVKTVEGLALRNVSPDGVNAELDRILQLETQVRGQRIV